MCETYPIHDCQVHSHGKNLSADVDSLWDVAQQLVVEVLDSICISTLIMYIHTIIHATANDRLYPAEGLCLAIDVCVLQLLLQLPHSLGLDSVPQRSWNLTKFPSPCEIRLKPQNMTFLYCIAHTSFIPIAILYSLTCTADFISQGLQHIPQEHAVFNPSTKSDRQHLSVRKAASSSGLESPTHIPGRTVVVVVRCKLC